MMPMAKMFNLDVIVVSTPVVVVVAGVAEDGVIAVNVDGPIVLLVGVMVLIVSLKVW